MQRADLTPAEEAYALADLIGKGQADVRELMRRTGKSRGWVESRLALLSWPEDVQGALQAGVISLSVAKHFAAITNEQVRAQYLEAAVNNGCSEAVAVMWAQQASFAETGLIAAPANEEDAARLAGEPQAVVQKYTCFACGQIHTWRQVNFMAVCGSCQDAIAAARSQVATE